MLGGRVEQIWAPERCPGVVRRHRPTRNSLNRREGIMYIGGGALVLILIIVVVVFAMRR
jgi:hypothetical protein